MSRHFVVDGYNLIWSTERFGQGTLQDQREKLLKYLERAWPAGSARNSITVVFDGQDDVDGPPWRGPVKVLFSRTGDGDALIKRTVDEAGNPRDIIVVSDDRAIQKWVRASGAKISSCADFLSQAGAPKKSASRIQSKPTPDNVDRINEELRRIWKLG